MVEPTDPENIDRISARRLILSQPRPPSSSLMNEDEDADGDDEDDGGDGNEERGVGGMYSPSLSGPSAFFRLPWSNRENLFPENSFSRLDASPELDLLTGAQEQRRKSKNPKRKTKMMRPKTTRWLMTGMTT